MRVRHYADAGLASPDARPSVERLDQIEASVDDQPGDAQAELEAVIPAIGQLIEERQADARQLMRNEDFAGGIHLLIENGLLLQRGASLILELKEQIRRQR